MKDREKNLLPSSAGLSQGPAIKPRKASGKPLARWKSTFFVGAALLILLGSGFWIYAFRSLHGSIRWSYQTKGPIDATPAVANGIVYVGSSDGNLYALDASSGQERWAALIGISGTSLPSSPIVVNGIVYVGSNNAKVYALDASSGQEKWSYQTNNVVFSSPAVANGVVYVSSDDGNLYALDAATGYQIWSYQTENRSVSSPMVVSGIVYVSANGNVYALDAITGEKKWSSEPGGIATSPLVVNDIVYVGADTRLYALDAQTGQKTWSYQTYGAVTSAPVISNGLVYIDSVAKDAHLYALDARTGHLKWSYLMGNMVDSSSPSVKDGLVYVSSSGDNLDVLNASTGSQQWSSQTGGITPSPTIVNTIVYIGSWNGMVYAIQGP